MIQPIVDAVKEYESESGAVYTCDVQNVRGRRELRWKRRGLNRDSVLERVVLEDAAWVSLEKCQPYAKQYRNGEIDDFEFMDIAKENAVPVEGERTVVVYILNGKVKSSKLIIRHS